MTADKGAAAGQAASGDTHYDPASRGCLAAARNRRTPAMPRHPVPLLLITAFATMPLAPCRAETPQAAPCAGIATDGPEVEAVRQLELRGARMNVDGWDLSDSRDFFAADFVGVQPGGGVTGLETIMRTFVNGRSPAWARRFDLTALDIRVFDCATAVVIGTAEAQPLSAAADAPAWHVRFLNVWRKQGGRWRYWANQFTPIAPGPGAAPR